MPMLLIGCDGGTNATSGIVPEITRKLYDITRAGRIDEARELQYKLLALFDAMIYSADFPEGFRAALALRGIRPGKGRQPMSEEQQIELEGVRKTLQCLLAEEGFADQPVGGCPAAGGDAQGQVVQEIVQGVLAELQRRGIKS
jgi:4-hydroxy-tetrahydrodipicolinate synthase